MIRKIDVGSVFGNAQRTSYEYMKLLNKKTNGNFKTLVVDDKDGLHSLPFANHGSKVVMYEPNEIYINGGIIDDINITPITNRKYFKDNKSKIEIRNKNFYESRIEDKYDFVYCYRSLHETHNKNIPMKRKIRKILTSVKDDGYIYIFYHMAKNERDISNFSKNQYFRRGEIGWIVSDNLVHKVCKILKIKSKAKHYKYKKPGEESIKYENIIGYNWNATRPFEKIVSDTTSFYFKKKKYDWAFYLDVFNNEIVGYDVRETMYGNGVINHREALNNMLNNKIKRGYKDLETIVHTDQGSVYSSVSFNNIFNSYNVIRSMSRAGTPTDNPVIESKNGWIKKEMYIDFDINNYSSVQEFIDDIVYDNNYLRPSYTLNYKTPIEFKTQLGFQ